MFLPIHTFIRASAWAACACVVAMVAVFAATGVGQDPLQFLHPPDEYARLLLKNPVALRTALGFDNLFLVLYGAMFVGLAHHLRALGAHRTILGAAALLLVAVSVLDLLENAHFLAMLAGAEQGGVPSSVEIEAQVVESLVKFHVSYLGILLLAAALPRRTRAERLLAGLCWWVGVPVGILIYVTPHDVAVALVMVRFCFFLATFALVGWVFGAPPAGVTAEPAGV